jgi:hypothetical protein
LRQRLRTLCGLLELEEYEEVVAREVALFSQFEAEVLRHLSRELLFSDWLETRGDLNNDESRARFEDAVGFGERVREIRGHQRETEDRDVTRVGVQWERTHVGFGHVRAVGHQIEGMDEMRGKGVAELRTTSAPDVRHHETARSLRSQSLFRGRSCG